LDCPAQSAHFDYSFVLNGQDLVVLVPSLWGANTPVQNGLVLGPRHARRRIYKRGHPHTDEDHDIWAERQHTRECAHTNIFRVCRWCAALELEFGTPAVVTSVTAPALFPPHHLRYFPAPPLIEGCGPIWINTSSRKPAKPMTESKMRW
jgi:hypothetical protein